MVLRAGVLSLGLLLLSRVLGLLRESAQAAAFGTTGLGDAVIVMFTLPDLLVGIVFSGALSYVLLPVWAGQTPAGVQRSQAQVGRVLLGTGLALGLAIWLGRTPLSAWLAPGLQPDMQLLGAASLVWSAAVMPLALLAALWVTRLQHERDFVGMYAGSVLVNAVLVAALLLTAPTSGAGGPLSESLAVLGAALVVAMLARLAWLAWRLPPRVAAPVPCVKIKLEVGEVTGVTTGLQSKLPTELPTELPTKLPGAAVWVWAALSSGLLLLLPLMARSLASQSGEGALATFNYAWKLVELPLVLAIQLVASLAFPSITRTTADTLAHEQALQTAFALAWALACAAIVVVVCFSQPLAQLLFGWGRMDASSLVRVAHWSAVGVWSLLPQALIAVVLTVMAVSQQMHVAVGIYAVGVAALAAAGWAGLADGQSVMGALNAVLAGVALALLVSQRQLVRRALPWRAMAWPLLLCAALSLARPLVAGFAWPVAALMAAALALLVLGAGVGASPVLRQAVAVRLKRA